VQYTVEDLTEVIQTRIKLAFDMSKISKDASKGTEKFLDLVVRNSRVLVT
jgi:hypothetical protein